MLSKLGLLAKNDKNFNVFVKNLQSREEKKFFVGHLPFSSCFVIIMYSKDKGENELAEIYKKGLERSLL